MGEDIAKINENKHLEFIEYLRRNMFDISKACRQFKISRRTYYNWLEDAGFAEMVWEAREAEKDFYENQLRVLARGVPKLGEKGTDQEGQLIGWKERPDTAAVIFALKTQAKDRGYVEGPEDRKEIQDSGLDFTRLSKEEKEMLFRLIDKATIRPDENITDAEIID